MSNIKAALVHWTVIQKEVDELLAKDVIEPSTDGTGFYFNVLVVPTCMGGLYPILNLKQFSHYMQIPIFKMPTIKQVWQLIYQGYYVFSIDLKDAYLFFYC